uniref:Uncharacterized protein n=1 Tax=Octopus bimaculoides TaxID=37653 RepID=A0A0L8GSY1_OCTBM
MLTLVFFYSLHKFFQIMFTSTQIKPFLLISCNQNNIHTTQTIAKQISIAECFTNITTFHQLFSSLIMTYSSKQLKFN